MSALAAAGGLHLASASTKEDSGEGCTTACRGDVQCVVTGQNLNAGEFLAMRQHTASEENEMQM
jgi:hypothetical protein